MAFLQSQFRCPPPRRAYRGFPRKGPVTGYGGIASSLKVLKAYVGSSKNLKDLKDRSHFSRCKSGTRDMANNTPRLEKNRFVRVQMSATAGPNPPQVVPALEAMRFPVHVRIPFSD